MGPGGFFPTNPDLADILGRTDLDFENFYFWDVLDPKFLDFQVPRFPEIWPGPGLTEVLWPTGLRSHLDQKMLIFYCKYWCLSSRPPVSCRQDESKCHQVVVFPDPHERRVPAPTSQGPFATPLEPLIASSVWGTSQGARVALSQCPCNTSIRHQCGPKCFR